MKKHKNTYKNFNVNILGQSWKVTFVHPVVNPENNQQAAGMCDLANMTLWIDYTMSKAEAAHTLIHEMFHAYIRSGGVNNAYISIDLEEIIADQFGRVMIDNFDFNL